MGVAALPLLAVLVAGLVSGCGIRDPYQAHTAAGTAATHTNTTTRPTAPDGPPSPQPPRLPVGAQAPTPQAALTHFARLYVNWQAGQLPSRSRQLAAVSIGQARAQALRLAARASVLERDQVTDTGSVVAIAAGQGQERGRWAVITNETTSGSGPYLGLPATSHVIWATVVRQPRGYVVSGWYPAS